MVSNKIRVIDDLPNWFKLESYDCLSALSLEEILNQVNVRSYLGSERTLQDQKHRKETKNADTSLFEAIWEVIENGYVHPNCYARKNGKGAFRYLPSCKFDNEGEIIGSFNIALDDNKFSSQDILAQLRKRTELLPGEPVKLITVLDLDDFCNKDSININPLKRANFQQDIICKLNLKAYTDQELIGELEKQLKLWRNELNISKPTKKSYTSANLYNKILDYKVLPYLDLNIWAKHNSKTIPDRLLAAALFPDDIDGTRGDNWVKQTLKPFVKTLTQDEFRIVEN